MDFITIISDLSEPTRTIFSVLSILSVVWLLISYLVLVDGRAERYELRNEVKMVDHGDLWKALKLSAKKRGSDHRE